MRKEILYAILAGSIFGLIIAFGIWRLNSTISNNNEVKTEASPTPQATFGITIAKPEDTQVILDSTVLISGVTKPNISVVISAEKEDYIGKSDANGTFGIETKLVGGINQILVTAIDTDGASTQATLTLVYSSEFANEAESKNTPESEVATSSDEIRQKVQEKVLEAQNIAFAYIGTVTDITEKNLQLTTSADEIMLVSTTETTVFVNNVSATKTVSLSDVAIGDFIVAMGYKNTNSVLNASRVLVITEPGEITRKVYFGSITEIAKNTVDLSIIGDDSVTLNFPKSWIGPDLDELSENDNLIAVGSDVDDKFTVRTIEVISDAAPSPTSSPTSN